MSHPGKEAIKEMVDSHDSYRDPDYGHDGRDVFYVSDTDDYLAFDDNGYHHGHWIVDKETGEAYIMRYNILGDKDWTYPKQFRVSKKLSKLGDSENIYRIHTYQVSISNYKKVLGNGNADLLAQKKDSDEGAIYEAQTFTSVEDIYGFVKRIQREGLTMREEWVDHIRLKGNGIW